MFNFIGAHPFEMLAILYVFSTIVSAMPDPLPSSRWYKFVYLVLHVFAANGATMLKSRFPALPPLPPGTVQLEQTNILTSVPEKNNGK